MSVKKVDDAIIVNDSLRIRTDVLFCGVAPYVELTDLDDNHVVHISTKQEAEQVIKVCEEYLKNLGSWDYVKKDA